jgi:hypothetical protein
METDTIGSTVQIHKVSTDMKWNYSGRNNLLTKVELLQISQDGVARQAANFELLEGLQKGTNLIINVFWTQYLTKSLELSVTYDGRVIPNLPMAHSARMQLKALF